MQTSMDSLMNLRMARASEGAGDRPDRRRIRPPRRGPAARSGVPLALLAALLAWAAPQPAAATPSGTSRALAFREVASGPDPAALALRAEAGPVAPRASRAELARWRGRFCTPAGCAGPGEASGSAAAGFAAAALLTLVAARRQTRPRD